MLDIPKYFISLIPKISILDRYIATEFIAPFLFGAGLFSSVGVTIGSAFELMRKAVDLGLPISLVFKVLALSLPQFISYAFPAAVLLAALLSYGRLSSDSELIALRSCGISTYRLLLPVLLLGCLITTLTFAFNESIVPAANYQSEHLLDTALNRESPAFREKNILYKQYGKQKQLDGKTKRVLERLFYAERFDGEQMKGITILDRSYGRLTTIVTSESGQWNPLNNEWDLFNGTSYIISPDGSYRNIVYFEHQQLQLPRAPLDIANNTRGSDEMNIIQSLKRLELERQSEDLEEIRKIQIRIHQKLAIPCACVIFGLVGGTLGSTFRQASKSTGFGLSVLMIFIYYFLLSFGDALGLVGYISPLLAGWLPNFVGLGIEGLLLSKANDY
ncbi:MAG: LptF/LptG family permease [Pseudanabaenales cyanobacterium]|nr:LptF/LptG family permease [Pseudanabaenales cyanobacterium]